MVDTWEATCERCGSGQEVTEADARELVGDDGSFLCDACSASHPRRLRRARRRNPEDPWRRAGCIVTIQFPNGDVRVEQRDGKTVDALRAIVERLPVGAVVLSISTWRSVLADVKGERRLLSTSGGIDPYGMERVLLARVGRLDLLPRVPVVALPEPQTRVIKLGGPRAIHRWAWLRRRPW